MAKLVKIKTPAGVFTPSDRNHLGTGGEASVYEFKGQAVKIYTDRKKMIPAKKIDELMGIKEPRVIRPNGFAYDESTGDVVGYTMPLIDPANCEPSCKFFTAIFKKDKGLTNQDLVNLVRDLRYVVMGVHNGNCLVVDLNELNILVRKYHEPLLIDTDSFQTPSFPATAIMESIRDFKVQNNKWSCDSDWFSWGVISFQILMGIHPYKGNHPSYKMKEWSKRMKDNVSVFDKDAQLPPVCPPFSVIPPRLRGWFEDTFQKGNRSQPPDPDGTAPAVIPPQVVLVRSTGKFKTTEIHNVGDNIVDVQTAFGTTYLLTKIGTYGGRKRLSGARFPATKEGVTKIIPVEGRHVIQAIWDGSSRGTVAFYDNGDEIDRVGGSGLFVRGDRAYTIGNNEQFTEISFTITKVRTLASVKNLDGVIGRTAKCYDGCVLQGMLGRTAAIIPFAPGSSVNRIMPELDGYRIVDAQAHWPTMVVIGEKAGQFDRLVFGFKSPTEDPVLRKDEDIAYNGINMTVTPTGLCVMLLSDDELGLCKAADPTQGKIVKDPPINSAMKLFADATGTYFVNGSSIFKLELT